ncbi:hypothetical protein DYB31_011652 [Aphanomyces astaci]|uniref:Tyrosinase copper-binding domain-containing protein n=1 Tax=Aphanomyces astaci TaxID=112090 RepID=A0A397ED74_APHAT|nr:hypothetical protein DYB31_011652 [Aphanomyces astaci]
MQLGHHHRFVAVHQHPPNEYEAHSCMLVYWHRRFLWGYENMLRSLGDDFQCITIPFWDYTAASSNYLDPNVPCASMAECNPVLPDYGASSSINVDSNSSTFILGGSTTAAGETVNADYCVRDPDQPATRSFCQSEDAFQTNTCLGYEARALPYSRGRQQPEGSRFVYRCIPRGDWTAAQVTTDMTLVSISNQVFAPTMSVFTQNIMYKVHRT